MEFPKVNINGNKLTTTSSGITANSAAIPTDGLPSLSYTTLSNRISTSGYEYDKTGNLIRGQSPSGVWQRFEYDAAGRLVKIKDDANNVLESYTYGASRERLRKESNSQRTYYAWGGSSVLVEYFEAASTPIWTKSYIYAGSRLLSTISNILGIEATEYHHPDRLGTKLVTNTASHFEQSTLPFGTYIAAESTGATNQTFTSYDRSASTGLDYAVNRTYNSGQSRFIQVDPIGMASTSIGNPQSMNLFAYVQNNPVDFIDPSGLLRVLQCTRYWWTDSGGIHYSPPVGCQTIYDDGGGGGNGSSGNSGSPNVGPSYDDIKKATTDCINSLWEIKGNQTFGVDSFDFAVSGLKNGSSTVTQYNNDGSKKTYIIAAEATSKSGTELSADNRALGGRGGGGYLMGLTFTGTATPTNTTLTSSIANDLYQDKNHSLQTGLDKLLDQSQATQIHELGVALSGWLGEVDPSKKYTADRDTGTTLEDCVYKRLTQKK